jgi:hypothetical protein
MAKIASLYQAERDAALDRLTEVEGERDGLRADLEGELTGNEYLRRRFGARDDETFAAFVERLRAERDTALRDLREARAEAVILLHTWNHDTRPPHGTVTRVEAWQREVAAMPGSPAGPVCDIEALRDVEDVPPGPIVRLTVEQFEDFKKARGVPRPPGPMAPSPAQEPECPTCDGWGRVDHMDPKSDLCPDCAGKPLRPSAGPIRCICVHAPEQHDANGCGVYYLMGGRCQCKHDGSRPATPLTEEK